MQEAQNKIRLLEEEKKRKNDQLNDMERKLSTWAALRDQIKIKAETEERLQQELIVLRDQCASLTKERNKLQASLLDVSSPMNCS